MATGSRSAAFQGEQRLYQIVARRISGMIEAHRDDPDWRMPTERELAEMLAVSRPVVREAVIALEVGGVVEIKGRSRIVVKKPVDEAVSTTAEQVAVSGLSLEDFIDARLVLETNLAALVARRASAFDLTTLANCLTAMSAETATAQTIKEADKRFARTIAEMSGNALLVSMHADLMKSAELSPVVRRFEAELYAPARVFVLIGDLNAILAALRSHNPNAAYEAIARHINNVRAELLESENRNKSNRADTLFADGQRSEPERLDTAMKRTDH